MQRNGVLAARKYIAGDRGAQYLLQAHYIKHTDGASLACVICARNAPHLFPRQFLDADGPSLGHIATQVSTDSN